MADRTAYNIWQYGTPTAPIGATGVYNDTVKLRLGPETGDRGPSPVPRHPSASDYSHLPETNRHIERTLRPAPVINEGNIPPIPYQFPVFSPNSVIKQAAATQYGLSDEARREMTQIPTKYSPNPELSETPGVGAWYDPARSWRAWLAGREPEIGINGPMERAPYLMTHELAHHWYYKKLADEQRAAYQQNYKDMADPSIQEHMQDTGIYNMNDPETMSTETHAYSSTNPWEMPNQTRQEYYPNMYDERRIQDAYARNEERWRPEPEPVVERMRNPFSVVRDMPAYRPPVAYDRGEQGPPEEAWRQQYDFRTRPGDVIRDHVRNSGIRWDEE